MSMALICNGQRTIDDIEEYFFSEIFNSQNSIHKFVELDEKSDTVRYWQFNDKQQLIRE